MPYIFIDTSYFIALVNVKDIYHKLAKEWAQRIKKDKIICYLTIPIIFEIADGFSKLSRREIGRSLIDNILNSENYIVHPFSDAIYEKALKLYLSREDKEWLTISITSWTRN